jgi:phosphatidylglycerol:prolipoprotein diacylglycerol transferase
LLPYVEHPVLEIGAYRLQAFPLLVAAALVVQFQIVLRRAPAHGIPLAQASSLVGWAILLGLLGAHLFELLVYQPERLLEDPIALLTPWRGISSFGGMLGGLLGMAFLMHRRRIPAAIRLRFVDCLMFALPFTLAVGRTGCALQHDHPGVSSQHWLAVRFPDGPRFDLGLLEFLYLLPVCAVFLLADRRRRPDGFWLGLFFALYGPARFAMDALRVGDVRYLGWTPGQYLSVLATLAGVGILAFVLGRRRPELSRS